MQKSGKNLIEIMKELQDAVHVADNVFLAHSAVEEVKSTVGQLAKAAKHVENGDVHLALALINDARRSNDLCAYPQQLYDFLYVIHENETQKRKFCFIKQLPRKSGASLVRHAHASTRVCGRAMICFRFIPCVGRNYLRATL